MRLTHELIKKKSEHNDGIMADLEEISLHQLEIEKIEAINDCRKLKILYLQNNIINKIENLHHLKDLEYLNLALNNVKKIEGLRQCEFLKKLDLTINFVDIENLESSIEELKYNHNLSELFLLGNPCVDWPSCQDFVIGNLPSLKRLDGTQITKTMQIQATQRLPMITHQLRLQVNEKIRKQEKEAAMGVEVIDLDITELDEDGQELTGHTPELRTQMYREQAAEKAEKEAEQQKQKPPTRAYDEEHQKAIAKCKEQEEDGTFRQCNTGGYKFTFDETHTDIILDIFLPKNLDTSLIDVHAEPTYVRIVIKTKVLRLKFDAEVRPDDGSAKRSKVTGNLLLTFPKVDQGSLLTAHQLNKGSKSEGASSKTNRTSSTSSDRTRYFNGQDAGKKKKAEIMNEEMSKAVSIRGIAKEAPEENKQPMLEIRSTKSNISMLPAAESSDDDDAPLPQSCERTGPQSEDHYLSDSGSEEDVDEEPPPLE